MKESAENQLEAVREVLDEARVPETRRRCGKRRTLSLAERLAYLVHQRNEARLESSSLRMKVGDMRQRSLRRKRLLAEEREKVETLEAALEAERTRAEDALHHLKVAKAELEEVHKRVESAQRRAEEAEAALRRKELPVEEATKALEAALEWLSREWKRRHFVCAAALQPFCVEGRVEVIITVPKREGLHAGLGFNAAGLCFREGQQLVTVTLEQALLVAEKQALGLPIAIELARPPPESPLALADEWQPPQQKPAFPGPGGSTQGWYAASKRLADVLLKLCNLVRRPLGAHAEKVREAEKQQAQAKAEATRLQAQVSREASARQEAERRLGLLVAPAVGALKLLARWDVSGADVLLSRALVALGEVPLSRAPRSRALALRPRHGWVREGEGWTYYLCGDVSCVTCRAAWALGAPWRPGSPA